MANIPSNSDDVIDSRDIAKRIEDLRREKQDLVDRVDAANAQLTEVTEGGDTGYIADAEDTLNDANGALADWIEENQQELTDLVSLDDEASSSPDWTYGETLIRYSHFKDYAMQLAEDIGAISGNEEWPLSYIDWDRATEALKQDYMSVDFDGIEYFVRA